MLFKKHKKEPLTTQVKHGLTCSSAKKSHTVLEKAVCITTHPGSIFLHPFDRWFKKKYEGKYKYSRLIFTFDIFLLGLALGLTIVAIVFFLYKPADFTEKIYFEADVAPSNVVSGASSTLVIRYVNGTGEELKNAVLAVGFPDHFLLQDIRYEDEPVDGRVIPLGTLPVDATGSLKIKGVMFGNVGGEQIFKSLLTFTHGEENIAEQKLSYHAFSPVSSTLALELNLPEELVAYQKVDGSITYKNSGDIDFPEISIEPEWPEQFSLSNSSEPLQKSNSWLMPAIKAGDEGVLEFSGQLGNTVDSVKFVFFPSFTFGPTTYRQQTLIQEIPLVPPQISVSHSIDADTLRPGSEMKATIRYENTGDTPVEELVVSLKSDSPFVGAVPEIEIGRVGAGETGEVEISVPLKSSISQSETDVHENLTLTSRATAEFLMGDKTKQTVTSEGNEISVPVTTPVVLVSFGRYASPQGDQLGRGPLPPKVGQETKYWIFWNIKGTMSALTNVKISGQLPQGVKFTGKQTVSEGSGVEYDPAANSVSWTSARVEPTFAPGSKIIGIAFEVGITPTESQIGTSPYILTNATITGTDAVSGAFVSSSGAAVSTNLPFDSMAAGLGVVE